MEYLMDLKDELYYDNEINNCEPILDKKNERFCLYPIEYHNLWDLYKKQQSAIWKAEEVDFSHDYNDWETLNNDEKHVIKMILAFFANTDGIVNLNISTQLLNKITINEAKVTYNFQMMIENVHCVSADTKILTDNGYFEIFDMLGKNINVWNGKEFAPTTVKFTGKSNLYKIELSNGMELKCTPEHKWFIMKENQFHNETCKREIIFTKDLKENDIIYSYELPILEIDDPDEFKNPYIHGFFCGNEIYNDDKPTICLNNNMVDLIEYLIPDSHQFNNNQIECCIETKINKHKFFVPVNYSVDTKIRWFEGIFDSNGYVQLNDKKNTNAIRIFSSNFEFIKNIQLMLTTLNINANIIINCKEFQSLLLENKEEQKLFNHKQIYGIYITISGVNKLYKLGFKPKTLQILVNDNINEQDESIKITRITPLEGYNHDTYCFNEPKEHAGIFNGCLTGQSEAYSMMLDTLIKDKTEKIHLFNAITTIPSIKQISEWAIKWIDADTHIANKIIAFACVEGIMFSGAFATIFWLKNYKGAGKDFLVGLMKSNEWIARDEGMHMTFACELYKLIINKPSKHDVLKIITESVEIASHFVNESIQCKLVGLNANLMNQYIKYVADRLLVSLGYDKFYKTTNPFPYMDTIGMVQKTNFHESRVTEYQSAYNSNTSREFIGTDDF